MRELQRKYYNTWDLETNLNPNEKRFDFIISGIAAGISACFAFIGTLAWTIYQSQDRISIQQQGLIAIGVFMIGNVAIYVLKDRMKDWLKVRFRKIFHGGRWVGNCVLNIHKDLGDEIKQIEVAQIERETWWTKSDTVWNFNLWEEFKITPVARTAGARIIKQVWKLPLDEILHSLDDAVHQLKLPSPDGKPKEVPVLKRAVFPYQLTVVVRGWKNKRPTVVDFAHVEGKIITSGRKIFLIE